MNILKDILIALIVAIIISCITYIWKNRKKLKLVSRIKLFVNINKSGMTHFYYNKDMLRRQLGTVGQEIGLAKKSFIYIGYTMSDIIKQDIEDAIIKAIIDRNVRFEFCILDESSEYTNMYAAYTGRELDQIKLSLKETRKMVDKIMNKLPNDKKDYIMILKHNMFIPSSCFLGDINDKTGWIHFNYKAPRAVKFHDFGFVVCINKEREFYENIKNSYLLILQEIYEYNGIINS